MLRVALILIGLDNQGVVGLELDAGDFRKQFDDSDVEGPTVASEEVAEFFAILFLGFIGFEKVDGMVD